MLVIRSGNLFDGESFHPGPHTLLVDGPRIAGIQSGLPDPPAGAELLDLPDTTMLPGLVDTHVHLVADSQDGALERVAGYTDAELDAVITDSLHRQLAAGVTTVRDLGDRRFAVLERRDRQRAAGESDAAGTEPTILASGPPITCTGGHCAYMGGEVADRDEMAAAIDERAARGVDVVKIMASGGLTTAGTDVMGTQFGDEDLAFLVGRAHAAGLTVTAHAHSLLSVQQVLRIGVDGIEHCTCFTADGPKVTDDVLEALVRTRLPVGGSLGTPPVELIANVPPPVKAMMDRAGITPEMVRGVRLAALSTMYRAGVRFVAGSDAGINAWVAHGRVGKAAAVLVEAGGSVAEGVAAATAWSADACGIGDRKGRLRTGYDADILLVDGDLAGDIGLLGNIRSVVLGGRVVG